MEQIMDASRLVWPTEDKVTNKKARVVPMQVLNFSFPRTGTNSLTAALDMLGVQSYHSFSWFGEHFQDLPEWQRIINAKFCPTESCMPPTLADFDHLLSSYGGVSEFPACVFAKELLHAYPDAKVILVERDIESWYTSFDENILSPMWSWPCRNLPQFDPWYFGMLYRTHCCWMKHWFQSESLAEARAKARDMKEAHYELVQKLGGDRVLVFSLEDGWAPLCKHLGKEVPDAPFPKVNDKTAMQQMLKKMVWRFAATSAMRVMGAVFLGYCTVTLGRQGYGALLG